MLDLDRLDDFAHLHVHSEYSLLDGLSSVEDLVALASRLGLSSLALTDHGNLYGAIDFYDAAKKAGVKPILGVEAYLAPRGREDRQAVDRNYFHLVLLAENETGYRNLLRLVTLAHTEGLYYKPRIDRGLLEQHHEGLICLSACYSGEPSRALLDGDPERARAAAAWYRDLFGPDRFYLELQDHGNPDDRTVNRGLLEISRELGIPVVATNDVHYAWREQADAQDILLAVQMNTTLDDPKRMRMQPDAFYLKSAREMIELFSEVPEAVLNTLRIAERVDLQLHFDRLDFPALDHLIPEGMSAQEFLVRTCRERLRDRYKRVTAEVRERLEYELSVVEKTGFAPYILFVWDYVDWARRRGIPAGPRGSAAGSIILYCLGISDVDPIEYGLTFERFLNPERIQMPDIDMDFADNRRDEVIEYVVQRYGRDHVAQIATFGRLLARAAIRDVGRALGYPLHEVDRIAKLVPSVPIGLTIDQAIQQSRELQVLVETQESVRRLIDAARSVEGVARNVGTHAAGVVVSRDPLVEHVPLQKASRGESLMAQYHMKALEKIGLLKMDFLGLANLTMIERAVANVERVRGIKLDLRKLPLDDRATFDMLSRGETATVFQLEGAGMTRYLRELKPQNIRHLAAMVALYRPGPMAHIPAYIARKEGREPVQYPHPALEPVLKETYGIIVYQDQVLQVVQKIAGYSLGQADILRRAMGKKLPEEMRQQKANFLAGAAQRGYTEDVANRLWEYIEPFAGYAFNKSHGVAYAFVAYQTAYLKANYPVEWMAAVLTTESHNLDRVVATIGDCRRLGIPVLPPDVNRSGTEFQVEQVPNGPLEARFGIRYSLAAVKNVGEGAVAHLIAERERGGPYRSLEDLCRRVDLKTINKRVLESLIKAGAFDALGRREQHLEILDQCLAAGQQHRRAQEIGQGSFLGLFSDDYDRSARSGVDVIPLPNVEPRSQRELLAWEKETLGLYLSDHPFQEAARWLQDRVTADTSQLDEEAPPEKLVLAGILTQVRRITTRKKETMVAAHLEDLHGSIEVVAFPRTYARSEEVWREDAIVVIEGKLDTRGERRQVIVDAVEEFFVPAGDAPPAPGPGAAKAPPNDGPAPVGANGAGHRPSPAGSLSTGGAGGEGVPARTGGRATARPPADRPAPAVASAAPGPEPRPPASDPSTSEPRPPSARLRLVVPQSGDPHEAVRLLEQLHRLLGTDGPDGYELELLSGSRRVRVTCEATGTTLTPALEEQLKALLGDENVRVDRPNGAAAPVGEGAGR